MSLLHFSLTKTLRIWQDRELRFNLTAIENNELICLTLYKKYSGIRLETRYSDP